MYKVNTCRLWGCVKDFCSVMVDVHENTLLREEKYVKLTAYSSDSLWTPYDW